MSEIRTIEVTSTVEVSIDQMAQWFSEMDDVAQAEFFNCAIKHMERWPTQWDALVRKLDKDNQRNLLFLSNAFGSKSCD